MQSHSLISRLTLALAVLASVVLSTRPAFTATVQAAAPAAQPASPQADCYQLFIPLMLSVSGGLAEAGAVDPAAGAATTASACGNTGEVYADFNGDGYADLAIGLPHKEVSNGIVNQVDVGVVHVIYGASNGLDAGGGGPGSVDDQVWHRAVGGVDASANDLYGAALAIGDFDNDGYDDLAIGIPGANINGQNNAGAIHVIYGAADGLDLFSIQEWARGASLSGAAQVDAAFGSALTSGDFDGDGYTDLAVGVPFVDVDGHVDAGGVHVLYGRSAGLTALSEEWLTQNVDGFLASPAEAFDYFGRALAAGDFDGDGVDDLAVGTPGENNGDDYVDAGAVQVFHGQSGHLVAGLLVNNTVSAPQHWTADSPDVEGAMEPEDGFGASLAAADFNGDGYADLAVGLPFETHGSGAGALTFAGAINVIHGSANGLAATPAYPARIWHQDVSEMADEPEAAEFFGQSLTAGDFNNDGYADLAIGVPGERTYGVATGAAHLMYGTNIGLTASGDGLIYDPDNPAQSDQFGATVFAADFNGDGYVDLAVGAPRDDPEGVGVTNSGSVFALFSDSNGVSQVLNQNWYPGLGSVKGTPAAEDQFGSALPGSPLKP